MSLRVRSVFPNPPFRTGIGVPAERVVSVEAVTGIDRGVLRPDLYGGGTTAGHIDEIDAARAQEYALLAALLTRAPDAALLSGLSKLRADASPLGLAHAALAEAADKATVKSAEREFFDLFIGLGRGELLPYGSYYLTGFLHERPLARLRDDLARIGITRSDGVVNRKIMPAFSVRSCRASRADGFPRRPIQIA